MTAPTQSSSYLDLNAIEAALTYLADTWPHQQMTATQREAWTDVLCQFHPGDLKSALRKLPGKFRPDPYAVLEVVLASRGSLRVPDYVPTDDEPPAKPETAAEWLAYCREQLKSRTVPCSPDIRDHP